MRLLFEFLCDKFFHSKSDKKFFLRTCPPPPLSQLCGSMRLPQSSHMATLSSPRGQGTHGHQESWLLGLRVSEEVKGRASNSFWPSRVRRGDSDTSFSSSDPKSPSGTLPLKAFYKSDSSSDTGVCCFKSTSHAQKKIFFMF